MHNEFIHTLIISFIVGVSCVAISRLAGMKKTQKLRIRIFSKD